MRKNAQRYATEGSANLVIRRASHQIVDASRVVDRFAGSFRGVGVGRKGQRRMGLVQRCEATSRVSADRRYAADRERHTLGVDVGNHDASVAASICADISAICSPNASTSMAAFAFAPCITKPRYRQFKFGMR